MDNDAHPPAATIVVTLPITIKKRGGLKQILAPDGTDYILDRKPDGALVKAVARAFRWRKMLEAGRYATLEELAAAEKINPSYISRVLRLTLLAPDLIDAILDGRQPPTLTLANAMRPFTTDWHKQMNCFRTGDFLKLLKTESNARNSAIPYCGAGPASL
jgi:hypothetical protein